MEEWMMDAMNQILMYHNQYMDNVVRVLGRVDLDQLSAKIILPAVSSIPGLANEKTEVALLAVVYRIDVHMYLLQHLDRHLDLSQYAEMQTITFKYEHHVMIIIQILSTIDIPALAYAEEQ